MDKLYSFRFFQVEFLSAFAWLHVEFYHLAIWIADNCKVSAEGDEARGYFLRFLMVEFQRLLRQTLILHVPNVREIRILMKCQ
jgi:hypothetical protein